MNLRRPTLAAILFTAILAPAAAGQSLFNRQPEAEPAAPVAPAATNPPATTPAPASTGQPAEKKVEPARTAQPAPANLPRTTAAAPISVDQASLFAVIPPKPRQYQKHDKIDIIINESSLQKHEQTFDAKKSYDMAAELSQFPSLEALITDLVLKNGIKQPTPKVGVTSSNDFKGEGEYERKDSVTARISALVLDVKPNGLLVIEATETIQSDEEIQTLLVSGICDPKDITTANTVQSSQLATLTIKVEHSGQVKKSATKGLIPRIFETLFNF